MMSPPVLFIYHEMTANPKAYLEACPTTILF